MASIPASLLRLFGPIEAYLQDPGVRRVLVEGPDRVFVERDGELRRVSVRFGGAAIDESLQGLARRAGKRFDEKRPCLEALLKDGTRFLALAPPVVPEHPVLSITRPGTRGAELASMVVSGGLSEDAVVFLGRAIRAGLNVIVTGAAGSGRTTMAEALLTTTDPGCRVGILEEYAEIRAGGRAITRLAPRRADKDGANGVSAGDLMYCAGRLGLERLVVGDLRRSDAWDAVAVLAGRTVPVLLVLPGLTVEDTLARLAGLARSAGLSGRDRAVDALVAAGVDLVVALGRAGQTRRVARIARVQPAGDGFETEALFERPGGFHGELQATGALSEARATWGIASGPAVEGDHTAVVDVPIDVMTEGSGSPADAASGAPDAVPQGAEATRPPAASPAVAGDSGGARAAIDPHHTEDLEAAEGAGAVAPEEVADGASGAGRPVGPNAAPSAPPALAVDPDLAARAAAFGESTRVEDNNAALEAIRSGAAQSTFEPAAPAAAEESIPGLSQDAAADPGVSAEPVETAAHPAVEADLPDDSVAPEPPAVTDVATEAAPVRQSSAGPRVRERITRLNQRSEVQEEEDRSTREARSPAFAGRVAVPTDPHDSFGEPELTVPQQGIARGRSSNDATMDGSAADVSEASALIDALGGNAAGSVHRAGAHPPDNADSLGDDEDDEEETTVVTDAHVPLPDPSGDRRSFSEVIRTIGDASEADDSIESSGWQVSPARAYEGTRDAHLPDDSDDDESGTVALAPNLGGAAGRNEP